MNIKQAKARFTELTGLTPDKKNVREAIWSKGGYVANWQYFAKGYTNNNNGVCDARTLRYWTTLVKYIEVLEEIV